MMASPVYIWFTSEVYFWRSVASLCWSILCIPGILLGFLLASNISIFHPFEWIYDSVISLVSFQVLFSVGVLSACLLMVTWSSLPHYSVVPEVESSQLSSALGLVKWSRVPLAIVCVLSGCISSWSLARLAGPSYQGLSRLLETDTYSQVVLNEHHLFLVASGVATGLIYYVSFFQRGKYYLYFPHVQRYRLQQIKCELSNLIRDSMWAALSVLKYFYVVYFLFGSFPKSWIEASFKLGTDPQIVPINSVRGILDVTLFGQTFLTVSTILFAWSLAASLVRVFQTEPITFPVVSEMDCDKDKTLTEALACNYCPLLQHLALVDLDILTHYSVKRRLQLLSLSQPGGHPRTWAAVSSQTLAIIGELCERVRGENWAILAKVSSSAPYSSGGGQPEQKHTESFVGTAKNGDTSILNRWNSTLNPDEVNVNQTQMETETALNKVHSLMKGLPFLSQFLAESPEYNSRVIFSSSQPQIWAVEALSEIASKAITEDKYGVVQTVLPTIIGSLLDLHEVLEKHMKLTASVARKSTSCDSPVDVLLKHKLFSFNKSSIYRIVNTYRQHLSDLRLSVEHAKKLQSFTDYLV